MVVAGNQCLLNEPRDTISESSDLGIFIQSFASNLDVGGTLDQFGRKLAYDFVQNHQGEGQLYGWMVDQASGYAAGYDGTSANGRMAGALALGAMLRTPGGAKGGGQLSKYDDITVAGSRYANCATDVTKGQFEKNLLDSGFARSLSKDGKAIIFEKDGARHILRDGAKSTGGSTADFYKPGSQSIGLKIRLEQGAP